MLAVGSVCGDFGEECHRSKMEGADHKTQGRTN